MMDFLVTGLGLILCCALLVACAAAAPGGNEAGMTARREAMVEGQLEARDITDPLVLEAMGTVPRHQFVPEDRRSLAYQDSPLPIGHGQTISQPYIVALMTQLAGAAPGKRALDVGTGSGYQAAVLAEIVDEVYSIEIVCELAEQAAARLDRLGYENVTTRCGDGYAGWPDEAPFDLIIVAAAPEEVPAPLIDQLAPGGRLVIPVGRLHQELRVIEKREDGTIRHHNHGGVRFVPMTGRAEQD
jgi:protein-L-isoaspartate(D-aspartate) O-methyltransferase